MKTLNQYIKESTTAINESEPTPAVTKFYRVNVGVINNRDYPVKGGTTIGDIVPLTYKYLSPGDGFVFGEPIGKNNWTWALAVNERFGKSNKEFNNYIKTLNNDNEFYQYFIEEEAAKKAADKAVNTYKKKKWTLTSLLKAINSDPKLSKLSNRYKITDTYSQSGSVKAESIFVSGQWRIRVVDGEILVDRSGWMTYKVANLPCLYMVLSADTGSDKDETQRQRYSVVVR